MEVNSIGWHENCLQNNLIYRNRLQSELERALDNITKLDHSIVFLQLQIKEAKAKNKTSFHADRFYKKYDTRNK